MANAFGSVPANPYQDRAKEFNEANSQPPANSIYPQDNPAPEPVYVDDYQQPTPYTQYQQPTQPQPDPYQQYAMQDLANERDALRAQVAADQDQIEKLRQSHEELEDLKRRAKLRSDIQQQALDNLETVSPEDYQSIVESVTNLTLASTEPLKRELEQQRKELDARTAYNQKLYADTRREALNAKIYAAHPDFNQLIQTPEYQRFMSQRDGLSSETRDARASREYLNGNTAYVIDLLNQFKSGRASAGSVATVPPVQVAPGAAQVPSRSAGSQPLTLRELNNLFQTRQITADEYRLLAPNARRASFMR